jgi:hypothetical protein
MYLNDFCDPDLSRIRDIRIQKCRLGSSLTSFHPTQALGCACQCDRSWPKAEWLLWKRSAGRADGLLTTQLGRWKPYRRSPKDAVHAPSGIVGAEWFAELGVWAFGGTVRL